MARGPDICRSDRLGRPPSAEEDRLAFQALSTAPLDSAERALFRLVSSRGMSAASERVCVETQVVLEWVRAGEVPEQHALAVLDAAAGRATYQGQRGADPRRVRALALVAEARLRPREIAAMVGVSRQTVVRWATQDPKPLGRPRRAGG